MGVPGEQPALIPQATLTPPTCPDPKLAQMPGSGIEWGLGTLALEVSGPPDGPETVKLLGSHRAQGERMLEADPTGPL